MTHPRDITGLPDEVGVTELCTFGNPVYTSAGRLTPVDAGFALEPVGVRAKPRVFPVAWPAVRALRNLRLQPAQA